MFFKHTWSSSMSLYTDRYTVLSVPSPASSLFMGNRKMLSRARTYDHPFSLTPLVSEACTITDCSRVHTALRHSQYRASSIVNAKLVHHESTLKARSRRKRGVLPPLFGSAVLLEILKDRGGKSVGLCREERAHLPRGSDEFDYRTTPVDRAAPSRKRGATRAHTRGRNAPKSTRNKCKG